MPGGPSTWWPRLHPDRRPTGRRAGPTGPRLALGAGRCQKRAPLAADDPGRIGAEQQLANPRLWSTARSRARRRRRRRLPGRAGPPLASSACPGPGPPTSSTSSLRDDGHPARGYLGAVEAAGWEPVGLRWTWGRARPGRRPGRVDRLERRTADGALRVVDIKTGSSKPSGAELARHPSSVRTRRPSRRVPSRELGSVSAGAALVQVGRPPGRPPRCRVQAQPAISPRRRPWLGARRCRRGGGEWPGFAGRRPLADTAGLPGDDELPGPAEGERL